MRPASRLTQMFAPEQLAGIRAMITAGGTPLGGDMMDLMPKLGAIVCYGSGYDGIDLEAAAKRRIAVGHSPGANASSVADIAMISDARGDAAAAGGGSGTVRSGNWAAAKPSPMMRPQPGMRGRRVGVYGMGAIGRKIAARVAAFESEVGYFSRSRRKLPYRYFPSLAALAQWCGVLMIAVRAGPDTHHAVDAEILRKLGPDGYVVNIARGSVIDQQALVTALADKTIAGAGLDVYATEPHPPDALTAFPNVVLTPHIGGHTVKSHLAMQDCVIANLEAFFAGRPLLYGVRASEPTIFGTTTGPNRPNWCEFCPPSWSAIGFALGKAERTRYTTASGRAGRCWRVYARIPKTRHDRRPFLSGRPHGLLEGKETVALEECGQGSFGLPEAPRSCPRLQAPAAKPKVSSRA